MKIAINLDHIKIIQGFSQFEVAMFVVSGKNNGAKLTEIQFVDVGQLVKFISFAPWQL